MSEKVLATRHTHTHIHICTRDTENQRGVTFSNEATQRDQLGRVNARSRVPWRTVCKVTINSKLVLFVFAGSSEKGERAAPHSATLINFGGIFVLLHTGDQQQKKQHWWVWLCGWRRIVASWTHIWSFAHTLGYTKTVSQRSDGAKLLSSETDAQNEINVD